MKRRSHIHVFLGPSLSLTEAKKILPDAEFHPPIRRGDLEKIKKPDRSLVGIVDGVFHQSLAVSIVEIRLFIENGGIIYGASSMGALRAAELKPLGMRGVGRIYEDFVSGKLSSDEDVALALHPDTGEALTIPTVQVKYVVREAKVAGLLSDKVARMALAASRKIFYPERTLRMLTKAWEEKIPKQEREVLLKLISDPAHDPKKTDAIALLDVMRKFLNEG